MGALLNSFLQNNQGVKNSTQISGSSGGPLLQSFLQNAKQLETFKPVARPKAVATPQPVQKPVQQPSFLQQTQQVGQNVATGVGGFAQEVQKKILGLFTPAGGKQIEIPFISKEQKEITPQLVEKIGKIKVGEKLPGYEAQKTPSAQLKIKQKPPTAENIIDTLFNKPADFLLNETGVFGETIKKVAKDIYDNPTDYVSPIIKATKQQSPQAKAAVESSPVYKAQNAALQGAIRGALEVVGNWNPRVEGFLKKENEKVAQAGGVEEKSAAFGKVVGQLAPYAVGGAAGAGLKIGRAVIPGLFAVLGQTTLPSSTPADARLRNAVVDGVAGTVLEFMKPLQTLGKTSVGQKVLEHSKYLSKTLGVMSTQVYLNARSLGASNEQALEIVKDSALLILGMHGVVTGIKAGQGLTKSKFTEGSAVFTPDQARGIVIGSNLENTPAGKAIIKASFEADSSGKNLQIDMTLAKKSKVAGLLNLDTPGGIRLTKIDFIDGTGKLTGEVPFKSADEGGPMTKAPNTPEGIKTVPISSVKTGLSDMVESRAKTDTPKIKEYEEAYKRGDKIPPVPVFEENGIQTLNKDGFHRLQAQKNLGIKEIEVRVEPKTELSGGEKQASENRKVVEQKEKTTVLERSTAVKEEFERATDNIEDFNERGDVIRSMVDERISRVQAGAISKEEIQDLKATRAALNKMLYGEDQSSDEMRRFVDDMKTMPETERFHSGVTDSIIKIDRILDAVKSQKGYTIEPNFIISKDKRVKPVLDKANPYKVKIDDTEFFGNDRKKVTEQVENYIKERNKKVEEYISKKDTVKFRTAEKVGKAVDKKELVSLHNLSMSGIEKALNNGGLPAPSLAVTKGDIPFNDFGEVTLVGTKDMVDPGKMFNHVYSGDIYTPRVPRPEYDLKKPIYGTDLAVELNDKKVYFGDFDSIGPNDAKERLISDGKYSEEEASKIVKDLFSEPYITLKRKDYGEDLKNFIDEYPQAKKLANQAQSEYDFGLIMENDEGISMGINDLAENKFDGEYSDALDKLTSDLFEKGEYTVENQVKKAREILSKNSDDIRGTEQGWGSTANPRIFGYKQFSSIDDIRQSKESLVKKEEAEAIGKEKEDKLFAYLEDQDLGGGFNATISLFKDIVEKKMYDDGARIRRYMSKFGGWENITEKQATRMGKLMEDAYKEVPTDYFEAKVMRPVGLEEFKGALIGETDARAPHNAEIIKKLKEKGLKVVVYDDTKEFDRQKLIEENFADEMFRFKDDFERVTGKTMTDAQEAELIDLNKKVFGDTDIKIVGQILANKDALGSYKTGMIRIVEGQANPKDTFYHEAVHKYIDTFSTRQEQIDLLLQAQKEYGIEDFAQVEEKIAEDFINYAKDREGWAGKLKSFFDRILTRIKEYFGNIDRIDKLYQDILSNKKVPQPATRSSIEDNAPQTVKKSATDDSGAGAPPVVEKGPNTKVSRFQERVAEQLLDIDGGSKYELNPETGSYNKLNLEKDAKAAVDFIESDPKQAMRVAMGFEKPPEGQTANAISIAAAFKAKDEGNVRLWKDLILKTSLRSTRFGQEIVSLRGKFNDDSPENFIKQVIDTRMNKLGKSLVSDAEAAIGKEKSVKTRAVDKIDREVERLQKRLKKDRSKIQMAQDIIDSLKCI